MDQNYYIPDGRRLTRTDARCGTTVETRTEERAPLQRRERSPRRFLITTRTMMFDCLKRTEFLKLLEAWCSVPGRGLQMQRQKRKITVFLDGENEG
ncbi:hypothetical protein SESBI_17374 [Sesbania bispinosa]|nr:hypothetical protein SESBI_17374 [Sesbania bispinosa]